MAENEKQVDEGKISPDTTVHQAKETTEAKSAENSVGNGEKTNSVSLAALAAQQALKRSSLSTDRSRDQRKREIRKARKAELERQEREAELLKTWAFKIYHINSLPNDFSDMNYANSYILTKTQIFYINAQGKPEELDLNKSGINTPGKKYAIPQFDHSQLTSVIVDLTEEQLNALNHAAKINGQPYLKHSEKLRSAYRQFQPATILEAIDNRPKTALGDHAYQPGDIVYGPLNKEPETQAMEDIIKVMLANKDNVTFERKGNKIEVTYRKLITITDESGKEVKKIQKNVIADFNRVLKFANWNHIHYDNKQYEEYLQFLESLPVAEGPSSPTSPLPGMWKNKSEIVKTKSAHKKYALMERDIDENDEKHLYSHLSRAEKMALNIYTNNNYTEINKLLRGTTNDMDVDSIHKVLLHSAMSVSALTKRNDNPMDIQHLLRRINVEAFQFLKAATDEGKIQTQTAFASTALEKSPANTFSELGSKGDLGMVISGQSPGLPLIAISAMPKELEYLLSPSTQLHFLGKVQEDDTYLASAEVIVSPLGLTERTEEEKTPLVKLEGELEDPKPEDLESDQASKLSTDARKNLTKLNKILGNKEISKEERLNAVQNELDHSLEAMKFEVEYFKERWSKIWQSVKDGSLVRDPAELQKQLNYEYSHIESQIEQYKTLLADLKIKVQAEKPLQSKNRLAAKTYNEQLIEYITQIEQETKNVDRIYNNSVKIVADILPKLKASQKEQEELCAQLNEVRLKTFEFYQHVSSLMEKAAKQDISAQLELIKYVETHYQTLTQSIDDIKNNIRTDNQFIIKSVTSALDFFRNYYLQPSIIDNDKVISFSDLINKQNEELTGHIRKDRQNNDLSQRSLNLYEQMSSLQLTTSTQLQKLLKKSLEGDDITPINDFCSEIKNMLSSLAEERQILLTWTSELNNDALRQHYHHYLALIDLRMQMIESDLKSLQELVSNKELELVEKQTKKQAEQITEKKVIKEEKTKSQFERGLEKTLSSIGLSNATEKVQKETNNSSRKIFGKLRNGIFSPLKHSDLVKKLKGSDHSDLLYRVEKNMAAKYGYYDQGDKKNRYEIYYENAKKRIFNAQFSGDASLVADLKKTNENILSSLEVYIEAYQNINSKSAEVALAKFYKEKIGKLEVEINELKPREAGELRYNKNVYTNDIATYEQAIALKNQMLNIPSDEQAKHQASASISDSEKKYDSTSVAATKNEFWVAPMKMDNNVIACMVRSGNDKVEVFTKDARDVNQLKSKRQIQQPSNTLGSVFSKQKTRSLPSEECMILAAQTFQNYFSDGKPFADIYCTGNGEDLEALAMICRMHTLAHPDKPVRCLSNVLNYQLMKDEGGFNAKTTNKDIDHVLDKKIYLQMKLNSNPELMTMIDDIKKTDKLVKKYSVKQ